MTIDLDGACCEEEAARLLPWYVAGQLTATDAERVASHLAHCAICRSDLAHELEVRALVKSDTRVEYAPQSGLATTLARIDELSREPAAAPRVVPLTTVQRRIGAARWLGAAVVVQAIGIAVLGALLFHRTASDPPNSRYSTLSSSPAAAARGPRIRAVFAPTMTVAELKSVLAVTNLTIVRGPSEAGVYTLAPTDPTFDGNRLGPTLEALRTDPRVEFAEPAADLEAGTP